MLWSTLFVRKIWAGLICKIRSVISGPGNSGRRLASDWPLEIRIWLTIWKFYFDSRSFSHLLLFLLYHFIIADVEKNVNLVGKDFLEKIYSYPQGVTHWNHWIFFGHYGWPWCCIFATPGPAGLWANIIGILNQKSTRIRVIFLDFL